MGKLEKEVKILDVNPDEVEARLQKLGAKLVSKAIQKIYVYDLTDITSRFNDCINTLRNCKLDYQYEVARTKLNGVLREIDNLTTSEEEEKLYKRCNERRLVDLLEKTPTEELLNVFGAEELETLISRFQINPQKWIRLRETNGKTTLTVKHILKPDESDFQPVLETEIKVPDIEATNALLEQLGFVYRNYQEKKRTTYDLNGVEVDIDSWPMIPSYVEIEHDSIDTIHSIASELGLQNNEMVSCNTQDVYKKYGIDIYKYRTLSFGNEAKEKEEDYER